MVFKQAPTHGTRAIFYCGSVAQSCLTLCGPHGLQHARPPYPSPTPGACSNSVESVMPSSRLILCRPLLLPSIFPSVSLFSSESALRIKWSKYWRFSFSISPSSEYSGLMSVRMDWFRAHICTHVTGQVESGMFHLVYIIHTSLYITLVNTCYIARLLRFSMEGRWHFFIHFVELLLREWLESFPDHVAHTYALSCPPPPHGRFRVRFRWHFPSTGKSKHRAEGWFCSEHTEVWLCRNVPEQCENYADWWSRD